MTTTRVTICKGDEEEKKPEDEGVHRLSDIVVREVSLVDRAANRRRFLVTKREDQVKTRTQKGVGTRGFVEDLAAEVAEEEARAAQKNDGGGSTAASGGDGGGTTATGDGAPAAAAPAAPPAATTETPAAEPPADDTAEPEGEETATDDDPTTTLQQQMVGLDEGLSTLLDLDDAEAKRRVGAAAPLLEQARQILATGQAPAGAVPVGKAAGAAPEEDEAAKAAQAAEEEAQKAAQAAAAAEEEAQKAAAAAKTPEEEAAAKAGMPPEKKPEEAMKAGEADGALLALATEAVEGFFSLVNMLSWTVEDAKSWHAKRFVEKLQGIMTGMKADAGKAEAVTALNGLLARIQGQNAETNVESLAAAVERMKGIAKRVETAKRDVGAPSADPALAGVRAELAKRDGELATLRAELTKRDTETAALRTDFAKAAARLQEIEKFVDLPSASGAPERGRYDTEDDGTSWPLDMAREA